MQYQAVCVIYNSYTLHADIELNESKEPEKRGEDEGKFLKNETIRSELKPK